MRMYLSTKKREQQQQQVKNSQDVELGYTYTHEDALIIT